jgi:DNA-directed RNA polymerase specialized sigma24 family protein
MGAILYDGLLFDDFYKKNYNKLKNHLFIVSKKSIDYDDICNEAFTNLYYSDYDSNISMAYTYLFNIAKHIIYLNFKKTKKEIKVYLIIILIIYMRNIIKN